MKKTTQKIAALIAAFSLTFPAYSFADDAAPEPANAPAAESAQAETAEAKTPGPAVISTGTANTIIKPDKSAPAFEMLERIETIIYGSKREGGLLNRLNDVERTIFGRELPGSLTERQTALIDFLERGTDTQPSVLFKLSVAEWGVSQEIHPTWPLTRRIDAMEAILEGANQPGPLVSRLERLLMKLLPEGIMATQFELPKETIVKGILRDTLTVRNVKVGDIIILALNEQIMVGDMLVAPKGSRVFAHITTVKPPRSFGRSSVIEMEIDGVEVLGPYVVPVNIGDAAKKAMEADSAMIGAAGASLAGAVLLGPVGLAGGFLIRGNDKQLKEGTLFYAQTSEATPVTAYQVPSQISPLTQPGGLAPQGTRSDPNQY
ncbi:hypothetical protein [uncultured Cloacibacillus sp.]|uniref:hypothetical protein n=1 Tax=uncultured Cloacibacillus sp. TaxID=889794 RepID=UPI0026DC9CA3|nr:hypothetical protein [uncultured Cloacibacillus sp.]